MHYTRPCIAFTTILILLASCFAAHSPGAKSRFGKGYGRRFKCTPVVPALRACN